MLPVLAAAHLLSLLGLLLLVGGAVTRRTLTPAHPGPGWLGAGFGLILLGSALEIGWTLSDLGFLTLDDTLAYLTASAPGRAVLTRVMGAALLLAAELPSWPALLPALAATALLWGEAGAGHGGSHGLSTRLLTALHAGAMATWLGGVFALLLHPAPTRDLARRFTPTALMCVALLVYSGAGLSVEHLGDGLMLEHGGALWNGLSLAPLSGLYGRTLLLKLVVFGGALLAAVAVRRAFARALPVRSHLAAEALLLLAVLGVTAALGTTPPPTHAAQEGGHAHSP